MPTSQNLSRLYQSIGQQLKQLDIDQAIEFIRKADQMPSKTKREAIDTLRALRVLKKTTIANSQNQSESTAKLLKAVSSKLTSNRIQKVFFRLDLSELVNQLMELSNLSADAAKQYQNSLIQHKALLDRYKKYLNEDIRVIKKQVGELEQLLNNGLSSKSERLSEQLDKISKKLNYFQETLTYKHKNSQDVFQSLNDDLDKQAHRFTKLEVEVGTSNDETIAKQLPDLKQQRARLDHDFKTLSRNKQHYLDEIKQLRKKISSLEEQIELIALTHRADKQVNKGIFKGLKKKLMQSDMFQNFKSQMDREGKVDPFGLKLLRQMQNASNLAELRSLTGKLNGGFKSGTNKSVMAGFLGQIFSNSNNLANQCQLLDQQLDELIVDESNRINGSNKNKL